MYTHMYIGICMYVGALDAAAAPECISALDAAAAPEVVVGAGGAGASWRQSRCLPATGIYIYIYIYTHNVYVHS